MYSVDNRMRPSNKHVYLSQPLLLRRIGGFLLVNDFLVLVTEVLRDTLEMKDMLTTCAPLPCGPRRLNMWRHFLSMKSASTDTEVFYGNDDSHHDILPIFSFDEYERLAASHDNPDCHSPGNLGELMRDIVRTFPSHPFFKRNCPGETMLRRVLLATLVARPDVGYCQGMNFVVGAMILGALPEALTGGLQLPALKPMPNLPSMAQASRSSELHSTLSMESPSPPSRKIPFGTPSAAISADARSDGGSGTEKLHRNGNLGKNDIESDEDHSEDEEFVDARDDTVVAQLSQETTNISIDVDMKSPPRISIPQPPPSSPHFYLVHSGPHAMMYRHAEYAVFMLMQDLLHRQNKLAMSLMWSKGVPKMRLRVYQLDRILKWTLPKLHNHLRGVQLTSEILVAQWFITLFSYTIPLGLTLRIFDLVFAEGWPGVFRVALSLLKALEVEIMGVQLEGIGVLMRDMKNKGVASLDESHHEEIMQRSNTVVVNEEVLLNLQESYALEILSMAEVALAMAPKQQQEHEGFAASLSVSPPPLASVSSSNSGGASQASADSADGADMTPSLCPSDSDGNTRHHQPVENGSSKAIIATITASAVSATMSSSPSKAARMSRRLSNPFRARAGGGGSMFSFAFHSYSSSVLSSREAATAAAEMKDQEDKYQLMLRYGNGISGEAAADMLRIRDELKALDLQVDQDKHSIQGKILRSCDAYRAAQSAYEAAAEEREKWERELLLIAKELEVSVYGAGLVAQAATFSVEESATVLDNFTTAQDKSERKVPENESEMISLSGRWPALQQFQSFSSAEKRGDYDDIRISGAVVNPDDDSKDEKDDYSQACLLLSSSSQQQICATASGRSIHLDDSDIPVSLPPPRHQRYNPYSSSSKSHRQSSLKAASDGLPSPPHSDKDYNHKGSQGDAVGMGGAPASMRSPVGESSYRKGEPESQLLQRLDEEAEKTRRTLIQRVFNFSGALTRKNRSRTRAVERDIETFDAATDAEEKLRQEQVASPVAAARYSGGSSERGVVAGCEERAPPRQSGIHPTAASSSLSETQGNERRNRLPFSAVKYSTSTSLTSPVQQSQMTSAGDDRVQKDKEKERKRRDKEKMKYLVLQSHSYQQRVIALGRLQEQAKLELARAREAYDAAEVAQEEALEWKRKLCEQLQRLVEDAKRGRTQKLQYITDTYML